MHNQPIVSKSIPIGFGLLLFFMLIVSICAYNTILKIGHVAHEAENVSNQSELSYRILSELTEIGMEAEQYRSSGDESFFKKIQENFNYIRDDINTIGEETTIQKVKTNIHELGAVIAKLEELTDRWRMLNDEFNKQKLNQAETERKLLEHFDTIHKYYAENDSENTKNSSERVLLLKTDFYEMKISFMEYLDSVEPNNTFMEQEKQSLFAAKIKELEANASTENEKQLFINLIELLTVWFENSHELCKICESRLASNREMTQILSHSHKIVHQTLSILANSKAVIANESKTWLNSALTGILTICIFFVFFGTIWMVFINRRIRSKIRERYHSDAPYSQGTGSEPIMAQSIPQAEIIARKLQEVVDILRHG